MKISTESWHYKAIDYLNWDHSNSLCFYFWQAVGASLAFVGFGVVLLFLLGILLSFPGVIIASKYIVVHSWLYYFTWVSLSALFWIAIMGAIVGFIKFVDFLSHRKPKESNNIVVSYIKAKKNKICPMIDFE